MSKAIDLIIEAGTLICVDAEQRVLVEHSLAIDAGNIVAVGEHGVIAEQFNASQTLNRRQHIVMPGLVNAHCHNAMSLLRGYADDLPLMEWLQNHIWPAESRWINEDFIRLGNQLAMAEMLSSGTTCFNDMYFFPDLTAQQAQQAGMRAMVGMIVLDFPTVWADSADEYLSKGLAVHDAYRHSELVSTTFAPHAPYTVSDEPLARIATLADELDLNVHMHVHETASEVAECSARFGYRPLERLDRLGLLSNRLQAVHMTQLLDAEIAVLAERGTHVIHCPASNLKLASGFCPVDKLLSAGINVAIGTDGAASNNNLNLLEEIKIAALLAKGVAEDASAMDANASIYAATMGGAKALGLSERIGSLEVGKSADIIAIDCSDLTMQPNYSAQSQVVYGSAANQVSDTWVAGKQLLASGQLTSLNRAEIITETQSLASQIAEAQ